MGKLALAVRPGATRPLELATNLQLEPERVFAAAAAAEQHLVSCNLFRSSFFLLSFLPLSFLRLALFRLLLKRVCVSNLSRCVAICSPESISLSVRAQRKSVCVQVSLAPAPSEPLSLATQLSRTCFATTRDYVAQTATAPPPPLPPVRLLRTATLINSLAAAAAAALVRSLLYEVKTSAQRARARAACHPLLRRRTTQNRTSAHASALDIVYYFNTELPTNNAFNNLRATLRDPCRRSNRAK